MRCASDESTRECVDAALMMFRQVQDASRTSTTLVAIEPRQLDNVDDAAWRDGRNGVGDGPLKLAFRNSGS